MKPHFRTSYPGVTLIELMIAVAILSIGVLGLVASFGGIQRGIQMSKNKTLAANLAQEKMQIIKQQTYFRIVPTMAPSFLPDATPYDSATFPPEAILEGSISFQRYAYVEVVTENSGVFNILPPTTPDTGMRQITVMVTWQERGENKLLTIKNVISNPNTVEANSIFKGTVKNAATNAPIQNALVNVAENTGWRDSTDGSGSYTIGLSPGSFGLVASADGYFSQYIYLAIGPNNTLTQNFLLTAMSSGSVTGAAWVNPSVVISQVVVSTPQANGYDVEYIELFNPTLNPVTVSGSINLNFVSGSNNTQCTNIPLTYINNTIPSNHYFIVANTPNFMVNGVAITADAYYTDTANTNCSPSAFSWIIPTVRDIMHRGHSGTWWLTDSSGNTLDAVGWTDNGSTHSPSYCNGTCIPLPSGGLPAGQQIVRTSSPSYVNSGFGRAYNSHNNTVDFAYPGNTNSALVTTNIQYRPFSSSQSSATVIAGVPAIGAIVSATDGLSDPTSAVSAGNPAVAQFSITKVATGTWTVLITSGSYELENDTVPIASAGSVYTLPSSTTLLNQVTSSGFISGRVTDAFGVPISSPSKVSGAGATVNADPDTGRYMLRVSPGRIDVTANQDFANPNYISVSSLAVLVSLGQITNGVDFVLSQGGRLSGYVTRDGVNGLQGVTMIATDGNGITQDQEITDVNGNFKTINITTGAYTVKIPLDTTESSSPTVASATVLLGLTVPVGTFTITGALGTISGNVTLSGSLISTGVLIVVTTGTLPSGPPDLSSNTLTTSAYYVASSNENGTYSVDVRQSTSPAYNIYGYYPTISNSGSVAISSRSITNVSVTASQTVSGKDLIW